MATREIKTIFSLDGETKYKDAIKAINKEQSLLRAETKALTSQYELTGEEQKSLAVKAESLAKQIELQKRKVEEAKNAVEQATKIYGENSTTTQEYKIQVAKAEEALNKLRIELQETTKQLTLNESGLKKAGEAAENVGKKLKSAGEKMSDIGGKMTVGLTAPLVAAAGYATKAATDFESAFAGVRKTVDATEKELADLEKGIREMSKVLPSSASEIAAVAEAAGQLGIQTENILSFSKAMLDLGNSTNLTADEAASALAQFANITQMSQKDFDRLGSVIVDLGNNFATTEKDIVNMAMRLAGAGKQVGLTEPQIMAIATALSSVGVEAEMGGSALSKVMVAMQLAVETGENINPILQKTGKSLRELQMFANQSPKDFKALANQLGYTNTELKNMLNAAIDLENFSKVSGKTAKEFKKAFKEDAAAALTDFIKGLSNAEQKGNSAIAVLDEMGITEVRMRDALLRSAGAGDLLSGAIERATKAWKENNALTKEAEQRYGTTESKMKIAKNEIDDAAITIGNHLLPVVADLTKDLAKAAQAFGNMDPAAQKATIAMLGVVAGLGPVIKTVGNMATGIGKASEAVGKFVQKLAEKKAAEVAAKTATEGLSGAIGGAGGLTSLMNPASIAITAVAVGLGALAVAAYKAGEDTRKLNDAIASSAQGASDFINGISSAKSALDGFDDSTIWTTENQEKLKKKVDETQKGITELTSLAVEKRRALTEEEYKRLQQLIEQLGAFADSQIEAYQQKNRILEAMAKNEKNMTEQRAQEIIKAAEETRDEIIQIVEAQRLKEYQVADEIMQNATKLREQKKIKEAEIEEQRAREIMAKADKEYQDVMAAENKKTADVIKAVQDRYMQQNQIETENLQKLQELYEERKNIQQKYNEELHKLRTNDNLSNQQMVQEFKRIESEYNSAMKANKSEIKKLLDERTLEVAGAMAGMTAQIEFYGGEQSKEAKKAVDGIVSAYDELPKKSKETMKNAMQSMIDTLKSKSQELWESAKKLAGGFINTILEKFEIKSPSRVMRRIAENITKTTADTIKQTSEQVQDAAANMADQVLEESQRMSAASEFARFITGSKHAISYVTSAVKNAVQPVIMPSQQNQRKGGDLIIPISINGEFVGEAKLTSEELARQEKLRQRAVGVPI